jgi:Flp pilus assembly protein TadG
MKRRTRGSRYSAARRGAAAVEFAIVLPLFVTIVLGCVDFGRFAHSYIAVSNAARAGAGHGMMKRATTATMANWQTEIGQAVQDEMAHVMASDGALEADLQVTATHTSETGGLWRVRVEVTYPFETIVPWPLLPQHIDLRRAVVMRGIR